MRVALYNLTTTTRFGGVESFVWDLARALAARDHTVTVIGGVGPRREAGPGVRVLTFPFIPRTFFQRLPLLRRAYAEVKLLERLTLAVAALPTLIRGGYEIIHLQKPYDLGPALIARRLSGARVLLGCHGEDFYRGDTYLARQIDGAVACSHFNAATVARRYGRWPQVIFNGIDTDRFCPGTAEPALRRTLGLPADAPLLLFVGRLQPWKGVTTALHALALLPATHLAIAGDGEERTRLEALAATLGLTARTHFLGAVERGELPRYYRTADLLVATSHASETFGIGLVEAQACGLPVVASRFGGFPEVVAEGHTGLLVPPRDPTALADAVRTLLADPARRAAFAAAAPAWAAQFAWPAVTDRVEAVYRDLLRQA